MILDNQIRAALVGVLNSLARPPALYSLACSKYPVREIQPQRKPDGTITVPLYKWGYEYKHRGTKPKLPPIDPEAIAAILNTALFGTGFHVRSVQDTPKKIILELEEEKK